VQASTIPPPTQLVLPSDAQAPTPQVVVTDVYASSIRPSQSLSLPSQTTSGVGARAAHESCT
jgi:hypothetical protein